MIRVLTLISLPLIVDSINDLAWYSPNTRSVPSSILSDVSLKASVDLCHLPPDVGGCTKELIRYYYDPKSDECKRFIFSGCGGNSNRFMRRTHCRSRCVQKKDKAEMALNLAKESKHRRTVTTAPLTSTTAATTKATTMKPTTTSTIRAPPASTRPIQMISKTKITPSIRECPHCDPIYGICAEAGDCGCIPGFKKLGRICIDINECDSENICPQNSRCVNTIGSHRCDCDSGFTDNGECQITKDACTDVFDINLTEEDCNNGEQLIRYYFDHESMRCKQFFYGGCKSTSRNIFSDIQTCDDLCASVPREALKVLSFGNIVAQNEVITPYPMKLNLEISEDIQTTTLSTQQQKTEADKIVKIMKEVNPNDNTCLRDFDEVLRLECVSAEWDEKFYWNYEKRECEPFWYDTSCDARDTAGKNFFESLEVCQKTCHEDVDSSEPMKDRSPPKKTLELPSFHPSIEEEGQRILESAQIEERHPLADLHEKYKLLKTFEVAPQTTQSPTEVSTPIVSESEEQRELTMNLQRNLAINKGTDTEIKQEVEEDVEYEEVTAPPVYRHPLEDIPIDEEEQPKKIRKMRKKVNSLSSSAGIEQVESQMKNTFELPSVPSRAPESPTTSQTATTMTEITETEATTTSTSTTTTTTTTTTQAITPSSQKVVETTPFVKIITLPTHVRLAPGPRMDPSTFATKSTPLSTFNREQYMLEFKKKLMSLPNGSPSSSSEEQPTFVLKPSASPRRPLFTLPPSVFEEATTTDSNIATTHRHRSHYSHRRDSNDIYSTSKDLPTTPEPDFITKEKTKVVKTLNELGKLADLCEEPLHPRLEEDCSNENWVIRWYFNTDKGACKSFWYGGCDSDARNFFSTVYSCKTACAHKYPVGEQQIHVPGAVVTTTVSVQSDHERAITDPEVPSESQHTFSDEEHEQVHVLPTDHPVKYYDISPDLLEKPKSEPDQATSNHVNETPQLEEHQQFSSENLKTNFESKDFCDDGYDEKWDEDCSNDDWKVRSYYDSKKKGCKKFWWGGCLTSNRNLWKDQQECMEKCGHKMKTNSENSEDVVGTKDEQSDVAVEEQPSTGIDQVSTTTMTAKDLEHKNLVAQHAFQADLSRQMASIQRAEENRADLAYSKAVDHPVTVASECLERFDKNLEKSCSGGHLWKNRFYYDPDTRQCKMYWNDGCFSTSRNNFDDIESCLWKCAGKHPEVKGRGCLEKFDTVYLGDCRLGEFSTRFYFDHEKKRCVAFHWGGCRSPSLNFFTDSGECEEVCERPPRELTQACIQPFDDSYKDSCSATGRFQQFYYFDHSTHRCQMFWYGNCKGENENIFPSLETCQWICERHIEERTPNHCAARFDPKYQESCGNGEWQEKWHFEPKTGECNSFWWDGCVSNSENIFPSEESCKRHCVHPGYAVESRLPDPETKYRCLEPIEIGNCRETYPAFYYDKTSKVCRPFAYSGCDGNGNRFMTLSQCEGLCYEFNDMTEPEMDCHQPLHIGYGKNDDHCLAQASYRFYYDREYGKCSQFWYLGCGGNANNFHSYEVCQRTCQVERRKLERKPRANSHVCSQPGSSSGKCSSSTKRPVQRWSYHNKKCVSFTYSGCGGNENRFATEWECSEICRGIKPSNDPAICSHPPDWGKCNQLEYMWFFNETRGTCDQFLYGGCGGNTNKFESFEKCQKTCEISGLDPCLESLDRGNWCEAMSNRYYFNKRSKACRGFHYTGCGKSANNFMTLHECKSKCEARHGKSKREDQRLPQHVNNWNSHYNYSDNIRFPRQKSSKKKQQTGYSGVKPKVKTPMHKHIILQGNNLTYFKSEPIWYDYSLCLGYRYNISGRDTILNVHLCSLDGAGDCFSQTLMPTESEEFCEVTRPFLRGTHLYSWYFGLDEKPKSYNDNSPKERKNQRPEETYASILLLKANHCHNIC